MKPLKRRDSSHAAEFAQASWVREFRDALDSEEPAFAFTATFRIEWRRVEDKPGRTTSYEDAGRAVRRVAESVASQRSVLRCDATEQDINHELRRRLPWPTEGIEIRSAHVSLHVDEHTRSSAERAAQLGREATLEVLARHQTAARIRFMEEEILRNPATARLYLMLEQTSRHGELPPGVDADQIVREVQQWRPDATWVVVAQLLHTFVSNLTSQDHQDLLRTLRALFLEYDGKELAERLPLDQGLLEQDPPR
ncbi:hypothetical protein GCM10009760_09280 [Kitasatospora kazusensis]|uniref:Uncharacterized protein n=1 Tax=Kitasatospora kazusensis TaxID=407974 RepID=A0ABP5KPG1_9ACTN